MSSDRIAYVIPMPTTIRTSLVRSGFRLAEFVIPNPMPVVDMNTFSMRVSLEVPSEGTAEEIAACLETCARAIRLCGERP